VLENSKGLVVLMPEYEVDIMVKDDRRLTAIMHAKKFKTCGMANSLDRWAKRSGMKYKVGSTDR
jgi:hypothetical protein